MEIRDEDTKNNSNKPTSHRKDNNRACNTVFYNNNFTTYRARIELEELNWRATVARFFVSENWIIAVVPLVTHYTRNEPVSARVDGRRRSQDSSGFLAGNQSAEVCRF